ncbi:hypothetical protein TNCV_4822591 [Trichonephila clavipes]|nr:hypothetical protein TNCV_4822591 [Trichonephila clavipes]
MSKSLALKASQRIRDVWSDWASDVGHFNSLWKVRRIKGQDEVLCIQNLSIPPYRYTPNITDVLGLHVLFDFLSRHIEKIRWAVACFADDASRNKSPERILRIDLTSPILLVKAFSIRKGETLYASTHHGAQQGEAARRSSDMRQARHLPQRWYWDIVVQPIDRSGLTPASRLRRSMGQRARNRNPRLHFPPVRVAAHGKHAGQTKNQS